MALCHGNPGNYPFFRIPALAPHLEDISLCLAAQPPGLSPSCTPGARTTHLKLQHTLRSAHCPSLVPATLCSYRTRGTSRLFVMTWPPPLLRTHGQFRSPQESAVEACSRGPPALGTHTQFKGTRVQYQRRFYWECSKARISPQYHHAYQGIFVKQKKLNLKIIVP